MINNVGNYMTVVQNCIW